MDEKRSLSTTYVVNKSNHFVTITLIIGSPGQTATTTFTLDGAPIVINGVIVDPIDGDVIDQQIGKNIDLDGKDLAFVTTVSNTTGIDAHAEVIVRLRGGTSFREFPLGQPVKAGESVPFPCMINFFNF